jgi:hypothetical protein
MLCGCSLYTVIWPRTRGSTTMGRSIIAAKARLTASTSALTKLTVTGARERGLIVCAAAGATLAHATRAASATAGSVRRGQGCSGRVMVIRSR